MMTKMIEIKILKSLFRQSASWLWTTGNQLPAWNTNFVLVDRDDDAEVILTTSMSRLKSTNSNKPYHQQLTWNSRAISTRVERGGFDEFWVYLYSNSLSHLKHTWTALLLIVPSEDISKKQNKICLLSLCYYYGSQLLPDEVV